MSGLFDRRDRPPPRPPLRHGEDPSGGYGQRHQTAQGEPRHPAGYDPFYDEAPTDLRGSEQGYAPASPYGGPPAPDPHAGGVDVAGYQPGGYQQAERRNIPAAPAPAPEFYAEARTGRRGSRLSGAAIVPPASVTGRSLDVVVAIMCFLACLTAGTVYMVNRSADVWLKDMASEVTVQVEPREGADTERTVSEVGALLTRTPGILSVRAFSLQESAGLLEPWLGQSGALKELPVPRLVAIELDSGSPPDLEALKQRLASSFKGVTLDDHRHWQAQIRTVTRSLALGGLLILGLVALATIAIIVSATRSAMASNSDIVEVLHFVGATDRFIAREFDKHFLKLGIKAGLTGALAAALVFLSAPFVVNVVGGNQSVTAAELQRLVGTGSLDLWGYGLLGFVVVVIAALCMITSRLGVFNILNTRV